MKSSNDYRKEVIDAYNAKKAAGQLPLILIEPTPAGLRDECLDRYKIAHSPNDEESLKIFFGSRGDAADYHRLIEATDIDKFRPLMYFLKDLSINTKSKNIELLAYLIDFEPRPFRFRYDEPEVNLPQPPNPEPPVEPPSVPPKKDVGGKSEEPVRPPKEKVDKPTGPRPQKGWSPSAWVLAVLGIVAVITVTIASFAMTMTPNSMYWTGEAYKRVFFWTTLKKAQVVPFDEKLFRNFKRVTQPDTLARGDIYNVWYAKITRDSIEFFTDSAAHPIDTTKTLKPMTEYIWMTWIVNKGD